MKRLIVTLTAGLALLALGACGKQETKPQEGTASDNSVQQMQPADEQKPAEEQKAEEQKPSAQADQYNGMAQAKVDDSSSEQDQDNQS